MDYAVETFGLTKAFGDLRAVDNVDLRVERGAFYGFLGPNGAGKSTTIKILTGLMGPTSGAARLLGYDLHRDGLAVKQKVGVVPEELCLFENLTAREYLTFIGRMYRMPKKVISDRSEELLSLMRLDEAEKTLVVEFSHGMKKKLALAAALIHDPELLFLDEPFEGIDAIASRTIRNVLGRLVRRESTIFLTSHILEIVEKLCSHVGIIHQGKLIKQGPLAEVAAGNSLEHAFIEVVGEPEEVTTGLSWLDGEA
ncbi:MAG TPA: ABC transporter ATP-binding protein [Candidatus Hydrogenedentes bacterium]|nr:ABC transporter ATP-binding protein [Candidatus Hydrogenedentota bacterium]HIJ73867.1 ABC transporter ATP-binding protein [Candidatus Hydrogenedentota bacterium]